MRNRVLLLVVLTVFLDMVGFGLVMPLLPLYVKSMNASSVVVGFILSFFSLAQLIATPILGKLSDKYGRRQIILFSLVGNAVSMVVFAIATTKAILWLFFLSRIIAGATAGNLSACQAVIADVTTGENRAAAMGRLGAGIGLGMIVGPVAGGWLGTLTTWAPPAGAAAMAILDVILTFILMPETRRHHSEAPALPDAHSPAPAPAPARPSTESAAAAAPATKPSIWDVMSERRMASVLVLYFLTFICITNLQVALALTGRERLNWGEKEVGNAFGLFGLIGFIVQGFLLGRIVKLVGELNLVIVGALFCIAGMTGIAFAHDSPSMIGALVLFSLGISVTNPLLSTLASKLAREENQGAVLGFAQSAGTLGRTIGPSWSGFLFDQFGSAMPFLSGAAAATISFLVGLSLRLRGASSPPSDEAAAVGEPPTQ